jgi:hypothetical protein
MDNMESYIQNYGRYNTIVDGNIIDETKWNMVYDGNVLDLEAKHNDESIYMNLNNNDIMKLLQIPANKKTMYERLEDDLYNNSKNKQLNPIMMKDLNLQLVNNSKYTKKSQPKQHSKSNRSKGTRSKKTRSKKTRSKGTRSKGIRSKRNSLKRKSSKGITPDYLKTIY